MLRKGSRQLVKLVMTMMMSDRLARGHSDMLLRSEVWWRRGQLENRKMRMRIKEVLNRLSSVPSRFVPQQENRSVGIMVQTSHQEQSRECAMQHLRRHGTFLSSQQVQGSRAMDRLASPPTWQDGQLGDGQVSRRGLHADRYDTRPSG